VGTEKITGTLEPMDPALHEALADSIATGMKWIELSTKVKNGEITDIHVLEDEFSKFMFLTILMNFHLLQSPYGDTLVEAADNNTKIRTA
jgi:hypothetical protein